MRLSDRKETFLSEVPTLMAEKEKADTLQRKEIQLKRDPCKMAVANANSMGGLNLSASFNLSKTSSIRKS